MCVCVCTLILFIRLFLQILLSSLLTSICMIATRESPKVFVSCHVYNSSRYGGTYADCTGRKFSSIPSNLPPDIVYLDVSYNDIQNFQNFALKRYYKLKYLIARGNQLKYLEFESFYGCESLQTLDVSLNLLDYNNVTFQTGVFKPLTSLITLHLEENLKNPNGVYPEDVFTPLYRLENLYIDTFSTTYFDKQFSFLYNLKFLQLGPRCFTSNLLNNSFEIFTNTKLQSLHVLDCDLGDIELDAFKPLVFLQHLIMHSVRPLGIRKAFLSLHGFQNRSIDTIHFYRVLKYPKTPAQDVLRATYLDSSVVQYLADIYVKHFIMVDCDVIYIDFLSLVGKPFLGYVEYLDIHENHIQEIDISFIQAILFIVNLRYLDLSFVSNNKAIGNRIHSESNGNVNNLRSNVIEIIVPRNISYVNICGITSSLDNLSNPKVKIVNGEMMNTLNMSFIGLDELSLKVSGLENIHTLDLSYNFYLELKANFLDAFPNLTKLYLGGGSIKQAHLLEYGKRIFQNLKTLSVLDLSNDALALLPKGMLNNSHKIQAFNLGDNKFQTFPLDIKDMSYLSMLDLSGNSLSSLDDATMTALDKIAEPNSNKTFSLMLESNLIFCGCSNLRFIQWLFETSVKLDNGGNYICISENGSITNTRSIFNHLDLEWRSCVGPFWLSLAIIGLILQIITILLILLVLKFKTQIICLFLRIFEAPLRLPQRCDFQYDAFVGCTDSGKHFVCKDMVRNLEITRKLKLYLRNRDILPGEHIVDGIMQGITGSWKTVFVLTQNRDEDQWMTFAVKAGVYNTTDLRTDRVLVLVHSEYDQQIPDAILRVIDEDSIFRFTPETTDRDPMWNHLYQAIVGNKN